jgi:thiamine biosynthesis lipoprotein
MRRAIEAGPATLTRRRFIAISAAAAGLAVVPLRVGGAAAQAGAPPDLHVWRGVALGAEAMLQIRHPDRAAAERLIQRSLAEVERLEAVFSLHRAESALARLNRDGALAAPPLDLVRLLAEAGRYAALTGGAFDATVQPLWRLYAEHFERPGADPAGPPREKVEARLALVDHAAVVVDAREVRFARPGMAVTLNGIAQGYITDRVAELLLADGLGQALVEMGETRALGTHPDGRPWLVGLEDPRAPGTVAAQLALRDRAVATSGGYGMRFDAAGRFNHILDPRTGGSSTLLAASVVAPSATTADALSTAFCLMPPEAARAVAERLGIGAHLVLADGTRASYGAPPPA